MNIIFSEELRLLPILIGVLAVIFVPFVSKIAEWYTTLIHELGHGVITIPFGGRVGGIHLSSDGSGSTDTHYSGFLFTPVRIFSLIMGYAFPVYVGLTLLIAAFYESVKVGGWVLGIIGLLLLFSIRTWLGALMVAIYEFLFLIFFVSAITSEDTLKFMVFVGFLFTIRGLIDIIMVGFMVFADEIEDDGNDFAILEDEVFFPAQFWYIFFLIFHALILTYFFVAHFPLTLSF